MGGEGKGKEKEKGKRRAWRKGEKEVIFMSQKGRCKSCKCFLDKIYDLDHIQPIWDGGSNDFHNLQALCLLCHAKKTRIEEVEVRNEMKEWSPSYRYCWKCKIIYSCFFRHDC